MDSVGCQHVYFKMFDFLDNYYEVDKPDDLGALLGSTDPYRNFWLLKDQICSMHNTHPASFGKIRG